MRITEVRIKLMDDADDRLQAFCSITFDDCFVVRDLKIIEGASGPFVAMPSRKLTAHCPQCGSKNHLRAAHCNQCGLRLKGDLAVKDQEGRAKLYADIAHPINSQCREMIQERVIAEYRAELERSQQPGYTSKYDEVYDYEEKVADAQSVPAHKESAPAGFTDKTHFDSAESHPRPHHISSSRPATQKPPGQASDDEFGAGIF